MRKLALGAVLLGTPGHGAWAGSDPGSFGSAGDPAARLGALRGELVRVMAEEGVPGAAISLLGPAGARARLLLGVARDDGAPVIAGTVFRLGSISKTLVALATLSLAREGRLDLDAPLDGRPPGLRIENPFAARRAVTPRMLLEHSSGLDDFGLREIFEPGGREDLPLRLLAEWSFAPRRVRWTPGTRHAYSNPGYLVLGRLLEELEGRPYEEVVEARVLGPLGMRTAALSLDRVAPGTLADGHAGPFASPVPYRPVYFRPAANALGSLEDLEGLVRGVAAGLDGSLGEPTREALLGPRTTTAAGRGLGLGYSAGLEVRLAKGERLWGHRGGGYSFAAGFGILPRTGWAYAVALNASGERALPRLEGLLAGALRVGAEREAEAPGPVPDRREKHGTRPGRGAPPAGGDWGEGALDPGGPASWSLRLCKANSRHRSFALFERLFAHRELSRRGDGLWLARRDGKARRLVPTGPGLYRLVGDLEASVALLVDPAGTRVLVDGAEYFEEAGGLETWASLLVALALALALGAPWLFLALAALGGLRRLGAGAGEPVRLGSPRPGRVHLLPCLGTALLLGFGLAAWTMPVHELGRLTSATAFAFGLGLAHGAVGPAGIWHALAALEDGECRVRCALALLASGAHLLVSLLLTASGIVGAPLW